MPLNTHFFWVFLINGVYKEVFKQSKEFFLFHSKFGDQMHQNKDLISDLRYLFFFFFQFT